MKTFRTLMLLVAAFLLGGAAQMHAASQLVQLKNARSGYYLYENNSALVHLIAVNTQEASKWILYAVSSDQYALINYSTGHYIQAPVQDQQVKLGTTGATFTMETSGSNVLFKSGGQYLNASNGGSSVLGWYEGDQGSQWSIASSTEISDEDVAALIGSTAGYTAPSTTGYFRIYNETRDNYMSEDYSALQVDGAAKEKGAFKQVWQFEKTLLGYWRITNALTGHQLKTPSSSNSVRLTTVEGTGSSYTISANTRISGLTTYYQIKDYSTGKLAHMDASAKLVNWYDEGGSSPTGNEWLFEPLSDAEAALLDAAKKDYEATAGILNNAGTYQTLLSELFEDAACTQLKAGITADNLASNSAYQGLPEMLQKMAMKVAKDSWADYEKFFRVADYHVYSDHANMKSVIQNGYAWGQLSNPTGIYTKGDEVIAVLVGDEYDDIPKNGSTLRAKLCLEYVASTASERNSTGTQLTLKKGLNVFLIPAESQFFIFYEINGVTNSEGYYLEAFPDLTIHIEGGEVCGCFDTTRGMTDEDWTLMRKAGLFNYQRLQFKTENVLVNWPGSYAVAGSTNGPTAWLYYWDNVARLENELLGLYLGDEQTDEFFPRLNVHKRFNNIFNVTGGGTDGSMFASSYGAYFGGSFSNLVSAGTLHTSGGTLWAPGHELGHCHQNTINMQGMGEVSNNLFSNMVLYELCKSTSRGDGMNLMPDQFARRHHWLEYAWDTENVKSDATSNATKGRYDNDNMLHIGWWCHTQMYYKLYEYFHMTGRDPFFYQKLCKALRTTPLTHGTNKAVPASEDYLRFAEKCCEVSGLNLSQFFEMFGFFRMPEESDYYDAAHFHTIGGKSNCLYLDDYGAYYVYVTQSMIDATKKKMAAYGDPVAGIAFIDDRFAGATNALGETCAAYDSEFSFGSQGASGCSVANYKAQTKATAYAASTTKLAAGGISVKMVGNGAAGFLVRDQEGELIYFSSFTSFTIPATVISRIEGDPVITVATTSGLELPLGTSEESVASGIADVPLTVPAASPAVYDLQGRRVAHPTRGGIYIINGRKVVLGE